MDNSCAICKRISLCKENRNFYFIHEFKNSIFVLGDHQYFKGYSLLLFKEHIRELHELPNKVQINFYKELMFAGKAAYETFKPWKMNYSCYGNTIEHVHWHIFPRYKAEPDRKINPWLHSCEFKNYAINAMEAKDIITRIKKHL